MKMFRLVFLSLLFVIPWVSWLIVLAVDISATSDRKNQSIEHTKKQLSVLFQSSKEAVECAGFSALPLGPQKVFETLDCYIVDQDDDFKTVPRFWPGAVERDLECDTQQVANALSGETEVAILPDYRGEPVISAYGPVVVDGETYAMLIEIDVEEVRDIVMRRYYQFDEIGAFICAVISAIATFIVIQGRKEIADSVSHRDGEATQMRAAIRKFPDGGVLIVNRKTAEIDEANTAFAKKLGYFMAAELQEMKAHDFTFMPAEHAGKMTGTTSDIEERRVDLKHKDGSAVPGLLSVLLLNNETALVRINFAVPAGDAE